MSKTQQLPSYAKGIITNELYDTGALTEYLRKLNDGLECSPYFHRKPKGSVLDFLFKKSK